MRHKLNIKADKLPLHNVLSLLRKGWSLLYEQGLC